MEKWDRLEAHAPVDITLEMEWLWERHPDFTDSYLIELQLCGRERDDTWRQQHTKIIIIQCAVRENETRHVSPKQRSVIKLWSAKNLNAKSKR
jgi:hypothetical protein